MNQHTEEGSSAARGTGVSYTEWARVSEPTSYPTNTVYTTYNEVSTKSNEYASSLVARADWWNLARDHFDLSSITCQYGLNRATERQRELSELIMSFKEITLHLLVY